MFLDAIEANVPAQLDVHLTLDNYGTRNGYDPRYQLSRLDIDQALRRWPKCIHAQP